MIIALGIILIIILSSVELVCIKLLFTLLKRMLRQSSDARTDARRARYRVRAYSKVAKRRALKKSRERLWEQLQRKEV